MKLVSTVPPRSDGVRAWLRLSDERDWWIRRVLAAELAVWHRDEDECWQRGYAQAEADMERAWREVAGPVSHGRSAIAEGWERRVRSAEAASKRAAWAHWHNYMRATGAA